MHRSAPRLTRILACAAVPVMLVVAGCSSDSDSKDSVSDGGSSTSSETSSPGGEQSPPAVVPAKFAKLPQPCKALTSKTVEELVPKVKNKSGTAGTSNDTGARGSCSWNGLEDKGVKGSNYRWLDVSFQRFESESGIGSGEDRAGDAYKKEVAAVRATEKAKSVNSSPASGVGEEATAISYGLTKSGEDFKYATIVARTGNVVVTVGYNGTGFAGAKNPDPSQLMKDAVTAAKEAVSSVAKANQVQ
ncbi:DUF3558 domain-containing protein [Streptomyces sp. WMMC940]|uniref:DUF3558 domain-containing protein n=1 Tax=Streptomyces sp. WMMC940 TaxID=3015153 RepID=UPI0022B723AD|nr:DUF3558 domain-containing protein [Streptomyces sp. WMMC940]MCZ7458719.1 DUF3558 domain-containing protein [Streptomyces sp. WMMC940]